MSDVAAGVDRRGGAAYLDENEREIKCRVGTGSKAFHSMKQPVICSMN